jgi:addiction module HigA family antidote
MRPSHPGNFFREEILDELGLSVSRAAEVLGVRRATLSDLVSGRAALSAEMALRVEQAFGVSMDTLLRMQAWYDGYVMRQRQREINVKRFTPKTASTEVRRVGLRAQETRRVEEKLPRLGSMRRQSSLSTPRSV